MLPTVSRFALDNSGAVRGAAIAWLHGQGADIAAILLQAVRQPDSPARKVRAGILGIAEIRLKDCLPDVLQHWKSNYPSIRAAVLSAAAGMEADHAHELCEKALGDPSPAVVRLACRLLTKLGVRFEARRLIELVRNDRREVAGRAAAYLSRHSNKWERLVFLLTVAEPPEPVLNIGYELSDWHHCFNRSATEPSSEQLAQLRALTDKGGKLMSTKERSELSFTLKQIGV
jgi:hypothetical protein